MQTQLSDTLRTESEAATPSVTREGTQATEGYVLSLSLFFLSFSIFLFVSV